MAKGWHKEPRRHSLARRGIKTAVNNKPLSKIPMKRDEVLKGWSTRKINEDIKIYSEFDDSKSKEFIEELQNELKIRESKDSDKRFYQEKYKMSGKWYYIIRDKSQNDKMIYSSELDNKKNIEKYSNRRVNLYNAQEDINKNF